MDEQTQKPPLGQVIKGLEQDRTKQPDALWQIGFQIFDDRGKVKYTVEQYLGQGGFGTTYKATDIKGSEVAIKVSKHGKSESIINEALRQRSCHHPNIAKVFEVVEVEDCFCIVMEYISGTNLKTWVEDYGGALPPKAALLYIKQIADALKAIHHQGVLHRDIKPENIVVRKNRQTNQAEAVLIDFGLAARFEPGRSQWNDGSSAGYAPLEQYSPEAELGPCTDVYALAATAYYCLTGTTPISAPNRAAAEHDPLKPPVALNPKISPKLNRAILAGMALECGRRPQTIQAWLRLVEGFKLSKYKGWLALLVAVTFLGVVASQIEFNPVKHYASLEYEFQFKYPRDWQQENMPSAVPNTLQIELLAPRQNTELAQAKLVIFVEQTPSLYSLKEHMEERIRILNQDLQINPNQLTIQEVAIAKDNPKRALQISYATNQGGKVIKILETSTLYHGRAYFLVYQAPTDSFQKYKKTALEIIDSFDFGLK
jgi:serine/threonine protein kinase